MVKEVVKFCRKNHPYIKQVVVETEEGEYLISYSKPIAFKGSKGVQLSGLWDYPQTTARYVACFLRCKDPEEVRERISAGEYELVDELIVS